mgnify:CR=1 FL=1
MEPNRRVSERLPCLFNCRLHGPRGSIRGTVRNMSAEGMFFVGPEMLAVGATVDADLTIDGKVIKVNCEVRHQDRFENQAAMGLRFLRLDPNTIAIVQATVAKLATQGPSAFAAPSATAATRRWTGRTAPIATCTWATAWRSATWRRRSSPHW